MPGDPGDRPWLDRTLSLFTDGRPGESATALQMLVNMFLLLICYSVIRTAREPLILLGGGAEVRSYAAAGQAVELAKKNEHTLDAPVSGGSIRAAPTLYALALGNEAVSYEDILATWRAVSEGA